jgi:hypothetical protein
VTWVKLDDGIFGNPKIVEVSAPAKLLHIVGICHCAQGLTNGRISKKAWPVLSAQAESQKRHVAELVDARLWHDEGTHWVVNDYLEYNPSREKVLADREGAKLRKERWKERVAERVPNGERTARVRGPRPDPSPNNPPTPHLVRVVDGHEERFSQGSGWSRVVGS